MTLMVGDTAPDFSMPTDKGGTVSLASLRGKKVVLYFYPKDDTPGCTIEACAFRDNLPNFRGVNAEIIGVSRDDTNSHQRFRDKFGLNFTLASDTDGKVTEAYGVWVEKNMYGKTVMGIQRATYLIDESGKIAHVWPKVAVDGHAAEVMAAIKGEAAPAVSVPMPMMAAPVAKKPVAPAKTTAAPAKKPAAKAAPAKKAAKKKAAPKKAAKKPAKKSAKKSAKKAVKAAAKKGAKKTAKKAAKKAPAKKKAAKKTATKRKK